MRLITDKEDETHAVNVLVESYANAPNISWMFTQSQSNLIFFFRTLIKEAVENKSAYLTSDTCGVLILENQHATQFSLGTLFRKLHLILFVLGVKNSFRIIRLNKLKKKIRHSEGYYGSVLAIRKHKSRWKTTLELKREFSIMAKKSHQPIFLETTNPRMFSLYGKLGFTEYHQMKHPYTDLQIYFMKMG